MPKKFSESEKEYITRRLKEEAMKCLTAYGVKKTTVDELVKRVNIPKGTFYLFYESKELLLFDVINDLHESIENKLIQDLTVIKQELTPELLTNLLFSLYKEVQKSGLLSIMMGDDLELLMRKLPEKIVKEHLAHDNFNMEQFFSLLPFKKDKNIEAFSGAMRGVFMTLLYKREIGEEVFDEALRIMLRGIIIQMMEEENHD